MSPTYALRRFCVFLLVLWAAASVNFVIPRLSPTNPIEERLVQISGQGGVGMQNINEVVKEYEARFGLDQPLYLQYGRYLVDMASLSFGYSLTRFPTKVNDMIAVALPWTIGLIGTATLLSFAIGTLLGAVVAWPTAPGFVRYLAIPLLTFSSLPYYLLGLILVYIFAFGLKLFPLGTGYTSGTVPVLTWSFIVDVVWHALLPAASMVLAQMGLWALGMRAMMVTLRNEDFMAFAEAKGLTGRRIFMRYGLRNAVLPQTTALALSLGHIVSGSILVEVVFAYPGVGNLLYQAVQAVDYTVIYSVVFMVILSIGVATFILDLIYPLLDPRISYRRA